MSGGNELKVLRAAEIAPRPQDEPAWLIEGLWGAGAVGLIGGAHKAIERPRGQKAVLKHDREPVRTIGFQWTR
jgi:hypothetical protein